MRSSTSKSYSFETPYVAVCNVSCYISAKVRMFRSMKSVRWVLPWAEKISFGISRVINRCTYINSDFFGGLISSNHLSIYFIALWHRELPKFREFTWDVLFTNVPLCFSLFSHDLVTWLKVIWKRHVSSHMANLHTEQIDWL